MVEAFCRAKAFIFSPVLWTLDVQMLGLTGDCIVVTIGGFLDGILGCLEFLPPLGRGLVLAAYSQETSVANTLRSLQISSRT